MEPLGHDIGEVLRDESVAIRPMIQEDAAAHFAGEDADQSRWLSGGASTPEGVRAWIERQCAFWRSDGPVFTFGIVEIGTNELIGMVEANTDSAHFELLAEGEANLSYGLYPSARRKGFATRAVNLVTTFLKQRAMAVAVIQIDPENAASMAVARRCGFRDEGIHETSKGEQFRVFRKPLSSVE